MALLIHINKSYTSKLTECHMAGSWNNSAILHSNKHHLHAVIFLWNYSVQYVLKGAMSSYVVTLYSYLHGGYGNIIAKLSPMGKPKLPIGLADIIPTFSTTPQAPRQAGQKSTL